MLSLNSNQRQYLRRLAHDFKPIVQVGKQGLSSTVVAAVASALDAHELIKVKFVEFKEERRELTDQLVADTEAALVALVGNVAILYRPSRIQDKQVIVLPR
ncbi:ribosome assembly RNA-binding protein YhbY [Herpetosiphon giganteus]|uniref:ribosome assembly RNA-binding protein YhbY n=1 Tax=Herpetosiphon giganteus TaxID=2029754 RepID=UPI001958F9BB|nr:ribosome assembly RNA-binding protein YhbY [Herpetosiphon giganteus]MBM7843061.1 RNA-binding protein [Herpetosiphon giganteus]